MGNIAELGLIVSLFAHCPLAAPAEPGLEEGREFEALLVPFFSRGCKLLETVGLAKL